MPLNEPIKPTINSQFEKEKLSRTIQECNDINTLKGIAINLLELHQKKSAIAIWATKRAAEAEKRAMKAELNLKKIMSN